MPSRNPAEKVVIGYLHPGTYSAGFGESLMDLLQYDVSMHRRVVEGGGRISFRASANLATPRNKVVEKFLEYGRADWLLMLDSDMTFDPDLVERLLEHADPEQAPVVGGLCFGFDENGDIQPTLYGLMGADDAEPEHMDVVRFHEWTPDSMYQVAATGAACLLIHKRVLETMRDFPHPRGKPGFNDAYPWFQEMAHNGKPVGEDIAFCWRVIQAGFPVYVNTAVQLGHVKDRVLTMDAYFLSRGLLSPTHLGATA